MKMEETTQSFNVRFKAIQLPEMNHQGYFRLQLDGKPCTQALYSKNITNISELHPNEQKDLLLQYKMMMDKLYKIRTEAEV